MTQHPLLPISARQLAAVGAPTGKVPSLFLHSVQAGKRFWEFFTANIRNRISWVAAAQAVLV